MDTKNLLLLLMLALIACTRTYCSESAISSFNGICYPAEYERDDTTYMFRNQPNHLIFTFYGEKEKIKNPKLVMELPPEIKVIYAFYFNYIYPARAIPSDNIEKTTVKQNGRQYCIWSIRLDEARLKKSLPEKPFVFDPTKIAVFFEPAEKTSTQSMMYWWLEAGDAESARKKIEINLLPEYLRTESLKTFRFYFYDLQLLKCPDDNIRNRLIAMYKNIGFTGGASSVPPVDIGHKIADADFEQYAEYSFGGWGGGSWGVPAKSLADKPEDILITLKNGSKTKYPNAICQTYIIQNSGEESKYFVELRKRMLSAPDGGYFPRVKGFINDYEFDMFSDVAPQNSCFCPRCLKAFSEISGIKAEPLSSEQILSSHKKEWYDFRLWQNGEMVRIYNNVVKSINGMLKTGICSGSILDVEDAPESHMPIDIRRFDEYADEHWPMLYMQSTEFYRILNRITQNVNKPVIPLNSTCFPVGEHLCIPPAAVRLYTIAAASAGCKGICYFTGTTSVDAEYMNAIAKTADEISIAEKFFQGKRNDDSTEIDILPEKKIFIDALGKNLEFPQLENFVLHNVWENKNEQLLTILNYHIEKQAYIRVCFPSLKPGRYALYDPVNNSMLVNDTASYWTEKDLQQGFLYIVPPEDVRFLLITGYDSSATYGRKISQQEIRNEYQKAKKQRPLFPAPASGLVGYWSFDNPDEKIQTSGSRIVQGISGKALEFNGTNGYAKISDSDALSLEPGRNALTIELWLKPYSFDKKNMTFVSKAGSYNLSWYYPTNLVPCDIMHKRMRRWMDTNNFLKAGEWNYLVFTYGNGYLHLYHNGCEVNTYHTGKVIVDKTNSPILISSPHAPFHGVIDEVKIYNRALSNEEIWMNYAKTLKGIIR